MLKGCKIRIYPTKEQEEILFIYCKYSHIMRNFLVAKYQNDLPKTNMFGLVNYNEKDLLSDFEVQEIPLPIYLVKGIIMNYKHSVDRCYKRLGKKTKISQIQPK